MADPPGIGAALPAAVSILNEALAKAVRMDGHRHRIEMDFMLTTGFWLLTSRKTARFCKWLE
jgi:hypothetical protein